MSDRWVLLLLAGWVYWLWPLEGSPWGDAALLLVNSLRMTESLQQGEIFEFLRQFLGQAIPQPPAAYLPLLLGQLLLPSHARLLASLLLLLLIGDAWRRLLGNGWMLAALLCSPMVWQYGWEYGWDLAAAAVVLQAVSWLERSRSFEERRASLAFGFWAGLGLLTKYTVPFFLLVPTLAALIGLKNRKNLLFAAGIALSPLLPWLLLHAADLAPYVGGSVQGDVGKITLNGRSWGERLSLYYLWSLKDAVGWPGLLLLLLGWGLELRKSMALRLPALGALGGMLLLSLLPAAVDRYALPALILGIGGLSGLRWLPSGPLLAAVTVGMLGVGSVRLFASARPSAPPSYQHSATSLSWPQSQSYRLFLVDTSALDTFLRGNLPTERGQVGLFLPFDGRIPDVGLFAARGWALGWRGEFLPLRPHGDQMPESGFPAEITQVLAMVNDEKMRDWLRQQRFGGTVTAGRWIEGGAEWKMERWSRESQK